MLPEQGPPDGTSRVLIHPPDGLPYNVVTTYLDNCRKGLPSLREAIARFDYDFVGVYSHRMKGCGAAYGFPRLTETGASMEEAARLRNDAEIRNCAAAIEAHLELVEVVEP